MNENNVIDALNEYYSMKNKYEEKYRKKYIEPILNSQLSKREKRTEYANLPKPECINCGRNVGTIFSITSDKENMTKKYIAKCGDLAEPCPLNIIIQYAMRLKLDKHIIDTLKDLENIKVDIIKAKNDALFFSNMDIVSKFEKLTQELKYSTETSGIVIEYNLLKNENPTRTELLRRTIDVFGQDYIIPFKKMISDYINSSNNAKLSESINFYINEMLPKLKEIMELKYRVNYVDYDPENLTYFLIQRKNTQIDNEYYFEEDDKIESFVKGMKKIIKPKKTLKEKEPIPSKQTRKKRLPVNIEIIEEPITELELKQQEIPIVMPTKIKDITGEGSDLVWNNINYENLWKRLPEKLRNILSEDEIWAKEYMYNCLLNRRDKKPCNMILPNNAKIPPNKLDDNSLDFGIPIINKIVNEEPKFLKDTLLTLYTKEQDGTLNYKMMKEAVCTIIENYVRDYNKGYF